jgi:hypothetical protein
MLPNKTLIRSLVLFAATLGVVGSAAGQTRIDNSRANDANNRLGSGGWNESFNQTMTGVGDANRIVTGNVTAGTGFRGPIGYTAPTAFRGQLPSSRFDSFISRSSGITTGGTPSFNALNTQVRPFYGTNTVGQTPGFTRDFTGLRTPTAAPSFDPSDTRIDFGGLDKAVVAQSLMARPMMVQSLNAQRVGSLSDSAFTRELARTNMGMPRTLSEFTAVGRRPNNFVPSLTAPGPVDPGAAAAETAETGARRLEGFTPPPPPSLAPTMPQLPTLGGVTPTPTATTTPPPATTTPPEATTPAETPTPTASTPTMPAFTPAAPPPTVSSMITDGQTRDLVADAESLMRTGRFASAIDRFDQAQAVTPGGSALLLGRAMAEMGAGYYRRAYESLLGAGADGSQLHAQPVDLVGTLTAPRIEFVIRELRQLAVDQPKDPMPLVLLAWIDTHIGNGPRAAEYARRALERADNDLALADFVKPWLNQ